MQEQHNDAICLKKSNLQELVQHNKVMESSALWDNQLKELEYKSNLMGKYKAFQKQGYSRHLIVMHFPEMRALCKLEDNKLVEDEEDKKPLSKKRKNTLQYAWTFQKKTHACSRNSNSKSESKKEMSKDNQENVDDSFVVVEVWCKKMKIQFSRKRNTNLQSSKEEESLQKRGCPEKYKEEDELQLSEEVQSAQKR